MIVARTLKSVKHIFVLSLLLLVKLDIMVTTTSDIMTYGEFDIVIKKAETCQGPKTKNCTILQINLDPGGRALVIDINILEDTKPDMGKIFSYTVNQQKSSNPLVRFQMNKPCDHVFLRPIFDTFLNVTESCVVKKGKYHYKVDVAKVAEDYFAGKFFYGNFSFKATFYNKKCNFSCCKVEVCLTPKY